MRLSPGDRLGPYEVAEAIGKGGMGEVYRGVDMRLGRPVAIKVSTREFSDRSEREARAISALNHPNICTLYDVGPNYLVMELVEGESLSKLIDRGPLPIDKALAYAIQIVDALAAAHAKGIVHRDLKPGNIMVTANGIKVLDFGLAKLGSDKPGGESRMETDTEPVTRGGTVLGTLFYMSPEQVEGKETDQRSDIFSFGVVLYEMITGQRPFHGDSQAAVLASLLKDQPPRMSQTRAETPRTLERVVRRCLAKKPDERWQSARDLKPTLELIDLDAPVLDTSSSSTLSIPVQKTRRPRPWLWAAAGGIAAVIAIGIVVWTMWPKPAPARATRFQVALPENVAFDTYVSVSPDGHMLLFTASGSQSGLWIHDLDTLEWRRLAGTEDGQAPFWSPDSRYLGFSVGGDLKKIDVTGGPPQIVCSINGTVGTGAWNKDGVILFGSRGTGHLRKVSSAGGVPDDVTELDMARGETFHALPTFLPDGRHFIYLRSGAPEVNGIYAGSLDAKPEEQSRERILANNLAAWYVDGNLFFMREGTLMVQPFDAGKLELRDEAVPVAEHVAVTGSIGIFSASPSGVLAYRTGSNNVGGYQPTWFDRDGMQLGMPLSSGADEGLSISPDGVRAAGRDAPAVSNGDVRVVDLMRDVRSRLTFHQKPGSWPVWTPDGKSVIFSSGMRGEAIYEKGASGAAEEKELLRQGDDRKVPSSVSHDGRFLLYYTIQTPKTGSDLWVLPLTDEGGSARKPTQLLGTPFNESLGSFSPDGRWIAYESNESGRSEIYVRPFAAPGPSFGGGKWQVSRDGAASISAAGGELRWRGDGKEIFYEGPGSAIMAVDVNGSGPAFEMGAPRRLFTAPATAGWDVTPDGKKFLLSVLPGGAGQTPITVVLNWQADLRK